MRCNEIAQALAKIYPGVIHIYPEAKKALSSAIRILDSEDMAYRGIEDFKEEYVTSIHWKKDDLREALLNQGINDSDENLEIYFPRGFERGLHDICVETGNEVIANAVLAAELDKVKI